MNTKKKAAGINKDEFRMFMGKYGIGVILFFILIILSIVEPSFRSINNFVNVAKQVAINGMIAYGMCLSSPPVESTSPSAPSARWSPACWASSS